MSFTSEMGVSSKRSPVQTSMILIFTHGAVNGVEPVFGSIKEGRGLRQFLRRGIEKVRSMWLFDCAVHNLLILYGADIDTQDKLKPLPYRLPKGRATKSGMRCIWYASGPAGRPSLQVGDAPGQLLHRIGNVRLHHLLCLFRGKGAQLGHYYRETGMPNILLPLIIYSLFSMRFA
jgi:hypothetical protein